MVINYSFCYGITFVYSLKRRKRVVLPCLSQN